MCVCVCLNPVSLPAEPAAKHAGSSGGCSSLLCLCVFLGCDWLPESPADCTLSLRRRERQADGGERDGVSCHFLSLSSIPPSFFLLCICQGRGGGREEVGGGRAEGGWRFGGGVPFIVLLSFSRGFNSSSVCAADEEEEEEEEGGGVVERLRGLRGWVGGDDGGMKRRRFRDDGKRRERKWRLAGAGKKRCCLS